ncbi:MAG: hypothetical protein PUC36_07355 [Clostridiales bacterium]|nr:hypothetical protein [Clostridiales bacterium]
MKRMREIGECLVPFWPLTPLLATLLREYWETAELLLEKRL